jgi:hypothetical protein
MTEPPADASGPRASRSRPPLHRSVLRVAAFAAAAATLIWSVFFFNAVADYAAAPAAPAATQVTTTPTVQPASQTGQPAQASAPVTTRAS